MCILFSRTLSPHRSAPLFVIEDVIARRTRLAFLNKDAALRAIPRVVELMGGELRWNHERQSEEVRSCVRFLQHFGGPRPLPTSHTATDTTATSSASLASAPGAVGVGTQSPSLTRAAVEVDLDTAESARMATAEDIRQVLIELGVEASRTTGGEEEAMLDAATVELAAELLGHSLSSVELQDLMASGANYYSASSSRMADMNAGANVRANAIQAKEGSVVSRSVSTECFIEWWNSDRFNPGLVRLRERNVASAGSIKGSGTVFG